MRMDSNETFRRPSFWVLVCQVKGYSSSRADLGPCNWPCLPNRTGTMMAVAFSAAVWLGDVDGLNRCPRSAPPLASSLMI